MTIPCKVVNGCIRVFLSISSRLARCGSTVPTVLLRSTLGKWVRLAPGTNVHKVTSHGGGGSHGRTDQMRAATLALPALEVPIAGGGAALPRLQAILIH